MSNDETIERNMVASPALEAMLKRAQSGDQAAFIALAEPYRVRLENFCRQFRADDVEDLVQETYIAAYKNIGAYRGEADIYSWMCSILMNRIRGKARKDKVRGSIKAQSLNSSLWNDEGDAPNRDVQDTSPSVHTSLENREAMEIWYNELSGEHRLVWYLHFDMNMSLKDIAAHFDKTYTWAYQIVHPETARTGKLKKALDKMRCLFGLKSEAENSSKSQTGESK